jgi:hypothetical protein
MDVNENIILAVVVMVSIGVGLLTHQLFTAKMTLHAIRILIEDVDDAAVDNVLTRTEALKQISDIKMLIKAVKGAGVT